MKKKVLVAYATNAGSTTEVAEAIGEVLGQGGTQVDVRSIKAVRDVSAYDAVLVGGPVILGWHGDAVKFVEVHQQALSQRAVAYFITALELTRTTEPGLSGVSIFQDPGLGHAPKDANKLSFKERQTSVAAYLGPVLKKASLVNPVSVGFFAGKLDYGRLGFFHKLFVKLIIRTEAGDFRNWEAIREWAASLRLALLGTQGG